MQASQNGMNRLNQLARSRPTRPKARKQRKLGPRVPESRQEYATQSLAHRPEPSERPPWPSARSLAGPAAQRDLERDFLAVTLDHHVNLLARLMLFHA